jgi:hypothetical protein
MLATLVGAPFRREGWIFEEKYGGVRMLAYKESASVRLISRNGVDRTKKYPEIVAAIGRLKAETVLLDGEIVVFDAKRVSRFSFCSEAWASRSKPPESYGSKVCLSRRNAPMCGFLGPLAMRRRKRFEVCDDGFRVGGFHVVRVHGKAKHFILRANSLFEDMFDLCFGVAAECSDGRNFIGPIGNVTHGSNPDGRALQPSMFIDVAVGVTRGMAFTALRDFLDEILAAFDVGLLRVLLA